MLLDCVSGTLAQNAVLAIPFEGKKSQIPQNLKLLPNLGFDVLVVWVKNLKGLLKRIDIRQD